MAGCGGSAGKGAGAAGSGSNPTSAAAAGQLRLLSSQPRDGEVQVAPNAPIRLEFDSPILPDSLQNPGTALGDDRGKPVAGSFRFEAGGRVVWFTPNRVLRPQTTYTFHLSPLTADATGRILDADVAIGFRTLDRIPPTVTRASISAGQSGVSRTAPLTVDFDEALLPSSLESTAVRLLDQDGAACAATLSVRDRQLKVEPTVDLAGGRRHTLAVMRGAVTDSAGNRLARAWSVTFKTAADSTPPRVQSGWPNGGDCSPVGSARLTFDESIAAASVTTQSLQMVDDSGGNVGYRTILSADQRSLWVGPYVPLTPGRSYTIRAFGGAAGITDVSGNPLAASHSLTFRAGTDATPPAVARSLPQSGATGVSPNVQLTIGFDETLDPGSVSPNTVLLRDDNGVLPRRVSLGARGLVITVSPAQWLAPGMRHQLVLRGGVQGVRDVAGNPLASDVSIEFHSSSDPTTATALLGPVDGNADVASDARVFAAFDEPLDPSTVSDTTVFVADDANQRVTGTLVLDRGNRVVHFTPTKAWRAGTWYTAVFAGGPNGLREASGNWLDQDLTTHFRAIARTDTDAPTITVTIDRASDQRKQGLTVMSAGFEVNVSAIDPLGYALDMSTVEVHIDGPGITPDSATIFAGGTLGRSSLDFEVTGQHALAPGEYHVTATVCDLSGNRGRTQPCSFRVATADDASLPFERTQLVWVRFDLDRDNNGRADLDDDLVHLGLISPSDPVGSNARMIDVVADGILARAHRLFGRGRIGQRLGQESVPLRLTRRQPYGVAHAQIACGGTDPESPAGRGYGDPPSGTLGRAFFDYRNGVLTDANTGVNPGLGVFPTELFLFEAEVHEQAYPTYTTTFAAAFRKLVPQMGGVPAGEHPLDSTVLSPTFDYSAATSKERSRYDAVFTAADDWASAIGVILAHEIGHSVGLTAEGGNPFGLHGDASLHNAFTAASDVMATAVSYDALIGVSYRFRDLNIAYLRQRLLMK